jgi:C4-dicarboxylate-specific signal transduction histidine kinase
LAWEPVLLSLHVISDSVIAIAYYTIPFALIYFISRRRDLAFRGLFALTGAFILACGTTHLMAVVTLWYPAYWLDGMIKFFTATVSIFTAAAMWWAMPKVLALPSTAQLEDANRRLQHEIGERERAEAALRNANADLEQRVAARIDERNRAELALRDAQADLARAARLTTMGELAASIAHEVAQPVAASVANANAGLRWLGAEPPDLEEARQALGRIVRDGGRASDILGGIRALVRKASPRKDRLDINDTIQEVIALTRAELHRNGISARTRLADGLPPVQGDRIQLQQVMLNLILNAADAMSESGDEPRELLITTDEDEANAVRVAVRDLGPGLPPGSRGRLFEAFYTTKAGGMGMGLSICRSIVEAHGGRVWATANEPRGAVFQFTLPREEATVA